MTAPRIHYRRPRPATAIEGPTGVETVLEAREQGRVLLVEDAIGRTWERRRADGGWWVAALDRCYVCATPTAEQVYLGPDRGWGHAHHRRCPGIPAATDL